MAVDKFGRSRENKVQETTALDVSNMRGNLHMNGYRISGLPTGFKTSSSGGRPPPWISILGHNFGVDQHFCTKFYVEMENRQPNGSQCSKIRFSKIQDGGRPPSWISILGHNFGVFSLLDQPRRVLHSG